MGELLLTDQRTHWIPADASGDVEEVSVLAPYSVESRPFFFGTSIVRIENGSASATFIASRSWSRQHLSSGGSFEG